MSSKLDCEKLKKNLERLVELSQEFKDGLNQDKPEILELKKKKKEFLILYFESRFPESVRMTIELGGKAKEALLKELEEKGFEVPVHVTGMLNKIDFVSFEKSEKIKLIFVSVEDLVFSQAATRSQIYITAEKLGLKILPYKTAFYFRLQYQNQPKNEILLIGSETIRNVNGVQEIFSVDHNKKGVHSIRSRNGQPGNVWNPDRLWVFGFPSF